MVTTYFKNFIMDNMLHTSNSASFPTSYYAAVSTTAPTLAGANVSEPAASTGYARVKITGFTTSTDGAVSNSTTLTFPESTASQGVVTHWCIFDAATGGHLLFYGKLTSNKTVDAETTLTIKVGGLTLDLDDAAA